MIKKIRKKIKAAITPEFRLTGGWNKPEEALPATFRRVKVIYKHRVRWDGDDERDFEHRLDSDSFKCHSGWSNNFIVAWRELDETEEHFLNKDT